MPEQIDPRLRDWALAHWPGGPPAELAVEAIPADGSPRAFWRLGGGGISLVLLHSPQNPPENRAWLGLARHLEGLSLPVAPVLAADLEGGRFLMADLGGASLQQAALACQGDERALARLYEPVLAMLAHMQARAAQGLDKSLCFDGVHLSAKFLLEREARYFLRQFVSGACGLPADAWPANLLAELTRLCQRAASARPQGFVHRDFQSRNILVRPQGLGLVDFQGGRLGPAQYDLAALLNDPYVDLPLKLRGNLLVRYIDLRFPLSVPEREWVMPDEFMLDYLYVAVCRAMQTLGAFAFLTRERGRLHFAAYVHPALATLRRLVALPLMAGLPALGQLLDALPQRLDPQALAPQGQEASF
jgi:aminoglycoside/choline kinase family phosphotransferase